MEKLQLGIKNTRRFRTRLTQTGAKPAGVFVLAGFTYFFTRTPTYWGWSERESRSLALPDRDRRQVYLPLTGRVPRSLEPNLRALQSVGWSVAWSVSRLVG